MKRTHTNPYRPQSDGLVERMNHTLIDMLEIVSPAEGTKPLLASQI